MHAASKPPGQRGVHFGAVESAFHSAVSSLPHGTPHQSFLSSSMPPTHNFLIDNAFKALMGAAVVGGLTSQVFTWMAPKVEEKDLPSMQTEAAKESER